MTIMENLDTIIQCYIKENGRWKTKKTKETYKGRLSYFNKYRKQVGVNYTAELDQSFFNRYQEYLATNGLAQNTVYCYIAGVKHFLKYLYKNNYLLVDLDKDIKLPKWERDTKRKLSPTEKQQIITTVPDQDSLTNRNQAILALYLYENLSTGLIANLTLLDLDILTKELRLKTRKKFQKLQPETLKWLKRYLVVRNNFKPKTDYLFIKQGGKRLEGASIGIILRHAYKVQKQR